MDLVITARPVEDQQDDIERSSVVSDLNIFAGLG